MTTITCELPKAASQLIGNDEEQQRGQYGKKSVCVCSTRWSTTASETLNLDLKDGAATPQTPATKKASLMERLSASNSEFV